MNNYYVGVIFLLALIFGQFAFGRWRVRRFQHRWDRAQEEIRNNNWVAAEALLRDCVRMMPVSGPVHRLMGVVLARRGKFSEAEERIRFGAELEPRNPAGFMELGFFLSTRPPERAEEAIDAFTTAVNNAPQIRQTLATEPRLEPLRRNERFRKLIEMHDES